MSDVVSRNAPAVIVLMSVLIFFSGCGGADSGADFYDIAVIPKGTTHEFWKSVHAGAVKAERELNQQGIKVRVIWKGPLREDDREQQIQVVEGFLSQGIDGIVLAPLDDRALVRPVEEARAAGIPTVIIDSDLNSDKMVSFIATHNVTGGELAAQEMGKRLEGRGKALLLLYQEGSASTRDREQGFLRRLSADFPGIELISSGQYAGPTRDTAKRAAENLLNRYGAQLHGIFCVNESSTMGMLLALQDIDRAGKVVFIGFDANDMLLEALRKGELHGLVVQNPLRMGYLGVKTMVEHLMGRPVEKRIDTGVIMVTLENVDNPDIQTLLRPPLGEYLE